MESTSLHGLLDQFASNQMNQMFTAQVGRVLSVDLERQCIDAQILVDKVTTDGGVQPYPPLMSVPLIYPASKKAMVSFPVLPGDTVLLVFCQRSIDRFKLGSTTNLPPATSRKYSINDAIAIPGVFTLDGTPSKSSARSLPHATEDLCLINNIGTQECQVRIKADGGIDIDTRGAPVKISIDGQPIMTASKSGVAFTVPVTAPDFISDSGISLVNHKHAQDTDSGGDKQQDTKPPKM